jgi:hypothetical protein
MDLSVTVLSGLGGGHVDDLFPRKQRVKRPASRVSTILANHISQMDAVLNAPCMVCP